MVFALLPVVIGTGVLAAAGAGPVAGTSRLETTQTSVAPLLEPASVGAEAVEAPASAAPKEVSSSDTGAAPAPAVPESGAAGDPAPVDPVPSAAPAAEVGGATSTPTSRSSPATTAPPASSSSSSSTTTSTAPPPSRSRNAGAESKVVSLTNADRSASGLGALSRNGCLDSVASGFAEQMARSGVPAHNAGAGPAVAGCRADATWGDNVGMSTDCDTTALEREWMASPGHRRNILTGAFTVAGVGVWSDEKGVCWAQVLFSSSRTF